MKQLIIKVLIFWAVLAGGCTEGGIFIQIATQERIKKGQLSENLGVLEPMQRISNQYYLASGKDLRTREAAGGTWRTVNIPRFSPDVGIQSMAGSSDTLYLALYGRSNEENPDYEVRLYSYTTATGFTKVKEWKDSIYQIKLFGIGTTLYVNVLKFSGEYGDKKTLLSSELFNLQGGTSDWNNPTPIPNTELGNGSYVGGMASNGTETLFSTVKADGTSSKIFFANNLVAESGYDNGSGKFIGLTWCSTNTSFLMASGSKVYVSTNGTNWTKIKYDGKHHIGSFVEINGSLILAGTVSNGSEKGGGYLEIDTTNSDRSVWKLSAPSQLAATSNYASSALKDASITAFYLDSVENRLFALTRTAGVWSISTGSLGGHWTRE